MHRISLGPDMLDLRFASTGRAGKSILCQEDIYLLELVRYIHLNPVRAKLVSDIKTLDKYPFCGHAVITEKKNIDWEDIKLVCLQTE